MKKASDVFKSIRFAKTETRDKPHSSTDEEGHYTVGEKEYNQQLKHVKKMAMQEEKKDKYDEGEYDQEGDMAKSDLRSIIANSQRLHDMIDDADNLPEWCQSKITLAEDYISTVTNYMTAELKEAMSPSMRMQRALQKAREQREREQSAGEKLLAPKQPVQKEEVEQLHEIGDTKKGQKLLQMVNKRAVNRLTSKKADTDPAYAKKAQQTHLAADERLKENTEQIDEVSLGNYKEKATQQVKELKPYTKGEYGDIAKRAIERREKGLKMASKRVSEEVEQLDEKNAPTNPDLWSRAKALAKSKFDVYPSAYANGWAAKWYKSKGGDWKTVSEEVEQLDEMPGANMDTRALHSHLKKKGWSLTRTSGSHDVFTHPKAKDHIAVPRHKQLKAPLVKGILKQSSVNEDFDIEDEIIDSAISFLKEGRPSQRHPLEGHEYHRKSDEALIHIAKDAHAAAEAMKGHNTAAENKYRDQANDSATVRHYRKTHGMADWYKKKYGHMKEEVVNEGKMKQLHPDSDLPDDEPVGSSKPPFEGPYAKKKSATPGKYGTGYSTVKHLAKQAMLKQSQNLKKPRLQEQKDKEDSAKANIIRNAVKNKSSASNDKFEANPELTSEIIKT